VHDGGSNSRAIGWDPWWRVSADQTFFRNSPISRAIGAYRHRKNRILLTNLAVSFFILFGQRLRLLDATKRGLSRLFLAMKLWHDIRLALRLMELGAARRLTKLASNAAVVQSRKWIERWKAEVNSIRRIQASAAILSGDEECKRRLRRLRDWRPF
jgi:hypothetical protein